MLLISLVYLVGFYQKNGDLIYKDVSLTGGTTITVFDANANVEALKRELISEFPDIAIRGISNIRTGGQEGFILETKETPEQIKPEIEKILGYELTTDNSSTEFTGATLSAGFYQQLISAIIAAFLLMAWVVFLIFSHDKKIKSISTMLTYLGVMIVLPGISAVNGISWFAIIAGLIYGLWNKNNKRNDYILLLGIFLVSILIFTLFLKMFFVPIIAIILTLLYVYYSIPSFSVILSALADIVMTVAVVDMMGINLSIAGVIAFLMLIGYSVDTDILLTSRLLKDKEGHVNRRLYGAFKTGITMTLTAIASVGISLVIIYSFSEVLKQIFTIILIGLGFDIVNTWLTNASMLKWYMEVKKLE
jgi:preprotein translocase subunit SecF